MLAFTLKGRGSWERGEKWSTAHYLSRLSLDLLHHGPERGDGACVSVHECLFFGAAGCFRVFMCVGFCTVMCCHMQSVLVCAACVCDAAA